jgi:S-formylglutathione hydrolase FrmB
MSRVVRAGSTVLVVLALLLGSSSVASAEATKAANPVAFADADGIHVVSATRVDARLIDFVLETAALAEPVHVRVLVPADYTAHPTRRYPSIYLLHGCSAGGPSSGLEYLDWSGLGAEQITADAEAIVVMPEAGGGGFYTDWVNGGAGGPPMWETFHVKQLVPWVDHVFRTISTPSERAIAGLSMGGFGSLSYASRHPDVFGEAASFSGAADLTYPADQTEPTASLVVAACALSDGGGPYSTFGPHTTDELNWRAHDPARLTRNLSNTALYLYTGNGQPGPLDQPGAGVDQIEVLAHAATVEFHSQLVAQGIPSFFDDYGPGTHTGPYWTRDFADVLPRFMADFAAHRAAPAQFTYLTAGAAYAVWGWRVHVHRAAGEFSALHADGAGGFALTGSGSATVVTAAIYRPASTHSVVVRTRSATSTERVRADSHGRLRITVPLGPANPYQEYTAAAIAAGSRLFTTNVTIS